MFKVKNETGENIYVIFKGKRYEVAPKQTLGGLSAEVVTFWKKVHEFLSFEADDASVKETKIETPEETEEELITEDTEESEIEEVIEEEVSEKKSKKK